MVWISSVSFSFSLRLIFMSENLPELSKSSSALNLACQTSSKADHPKASAIHFIPFRFRVLLFGDLVYLFSFSASCLLAAVLLLLLSAVFVFWGILDFSCCLLFFPFAKGQIRRAPDLRDSSFLPGIWDKDKPKHTTPPDRQNYIPHLKKVSVGDLLPAKGPKGIADLL